MKQITFSLPGSLMGNATQAILLGDFNNWDPAQATVLIAQNDGTLKADVWLEPGKTYEYRFLLNDGRWVNDAAAQAQVFKPEVGAENSVIVVPEEPAAQTAVSDEVAPAVKATKAKITRSAAKKATVIPDDDFTKIEGISPEITKILEAEGINNFKALSKASSRKLKKILEAAGPEFQIHNLSSWAKQAKLAAAGKWEELKELQQTLTAGK